MLVSVRFVFVSDSFSFRSVCDPFVFVFDAFPLFHLVSCSIRSRFVSCSVPLRVRVVLSSFHVRSVLVFVSFAFSIRVVLRAVLASCRFRVVLDSLSFNFCFTLVSFSFSFSFRL